MGYRLMTGGAGHKGAIRNSRSRPIETILCLRIHTGARLETLGATKCIACGVAIGRAVLRGCALLAPRDYVLRRYRKSRTTGAAGKEGERDCRHHHHPRWPSPVHRNSLPQSLKKRLPGGESSPTPTPRTRKRCTLGGAKLLWAYPVGLLSNADLGLLG